MSFRIDKVYTRTGDTGETGLVGGQRLPKDALRIEAYGTVDELNSAIGMIRTAVAALSNAGLREPLLQELKKIQQQLFNLGGELACLPEHLLPNQPLVTEQSIAGLEKTIDRWTDELEPLKTFILPGGGPISGWAHMARTICRRAERLTVRLCREEPKTRKETVHYLNRLSDYLFVLARWVAKTCGETEFLWEKLPV